jgi:hypothetical protein
MRCVQSEHRVWEINQPTVQFGSGCEGNPRLRAGAVLLMLLLTARAAEAYVPFLDCPRTLRLGHV